MIYKKFDDFISDVKKMNGQFPIFIWGKGLYGAMLGKLFNKYSVMWNGYYDNITLSESGNLNNKPVKSAKVDRIETDAVYVLSMRNFTSVQTQLLNENVDPQNIMCFEGVDIFNEIQNIAIDIPYNSDAVKKFKNKHKGEDCFIIGNGPSLISEDLEKIHKSGICSMASNLIFRCYDTVDWRPNYHFFTDAIGLRETFRSKELLKNILDNCGYFFARYASEILQYYNDEDITNLVLLNSVFSDNKNEFEFSTDCAEKIYMGYTVTYAMFQMAVYMGFKRIYLLGMDHTASIQEKKDGDLVQNDKVTDHASILGNYPMWGISRLDKVTAAYTVAKEYADSCGVEIYNATRGGYLEVFPRVDFDSLF